MRTIGRKTTRRGFLALGAGTLFAKVPELKIAKVETFILRDPPIRDKPESAFVSMTPMGDMTGGVGLWNRLERSETVRQGGYRHTLLVKVTAENGLYGWGESHAVMTPRVVKTAITDLFTPIIMGQDARNIEPLWEKMYSTQRLRGYGTGFFTRAMAGIDIALWDLVGKAAGVPVYQMLGGKFRDTIPTYAGVGGNTFDDLKNNARRLLERGFTTMKMGLGKGRGPTRDPKRVAVVSEVIGDKGQVLVDSLAAYTLAEATIRGRELDALGNVGWWEDVLVPEDSDGYARLADALDVPICAGEQYSNRFQFRDLFHQRAADIVNPDISRVGLTETRRIAIMADAHGVLFSPHSSMGSAPYRAAAIHVCAASPNTVILEGGTSHERAFGNALLKEPLGYKPGSVEVPRRPGLGVEFDEKALERLVVG
ncbi:MAG: mandelate racemase/muconate lactonizing enzyme family protein [bacterium]|nr:mandelate racemase/muconate lactonizing enzyme family protein [bacterium]